MPSGEKRGWVAETGSTGAVSAAVDDLALAARRREPDPAGVPGHVRDAPLLPRHGGAIGDRRVEDEVAFAGDALGPLLVLRIDDDDVLIGLSRDHAGDEAAVRAGDRGGDPAGETGELAGRAAVDGEGVELAVRRHEDDGLGVQPVEDAAAVRGGRLGAGIGGQPARRATVGRQQHDVAAAVEAFEVRQPAAVRRPVGLGQRPDPRDHACRHSHRPHPPHARGHRESMRWAERA